MQAWKPIATAPDDGVPILVCNKDTGEARVAVRKLFYDKSRAYEWFRDEARRR